MKVNSFLLQSITKIKFFRIFSWEQIIFFKKRFQRRTSIPFQWTQITEDIEAPEVHYFPLKFTDTPSQGFHTPSKSLAGRYRWKVPQMPSPIKIFYPKITPTQPTHARIVHFVPSRGANHTNILAPQINQITHTTCAIIGHFSTAAVGWAIAGAPLEHEKRLLSSNK